MRRLLWPLAGLALLALGLWLAGRAPSTYVLEQECARYQQERRERLTRLTFELGRPDAAPELRARVNEMLVETRPIEIRGWLVVLVPPGALPPRQGFRLVARIDASKPDDPAPLKGQMQAWLRPAGWLARLFSRG